MPGLIERLQRGIDVADVGCGSGHAINLMAEAFPASRFVGFDISEAGLATGIAEAERKRLTNVRFEQQDAARLEASEQFDFITTFDAVHDQARPDLVLHSIARVAPPGRGLPVRRHRRLERSGRQPHPSARAVPVHDLLHALHDCLPRGWRHGARHHVGEQKARQMLADAGFTSVDLKHVEGDIANSYYIATRA